MATQEENITTIKNFCKIAQSYGVMRIEATYDGSGDSGDINISVAHQIPQTAIVPGAPPARPAFPDDTIRNPYLRHEDLSYFFRNIIKEKDALVTETKILEFEDAVTDLLPDYWVNDDGSFGEITINVFEGTVKIEHNERVVEINTSNYDYS
jgi:hypothetical protein